MTALWAYVVGSYVVGAALEGAWAVWFFSKYDSPWGPPPCRRG